MKNTATINRNRLAGALFIAAPSFPLRQHLSLKLSRRIKMPAF
jgi:hypothetical protein